MKRLLTSWLKPSAWVCAWAACTLWLPALPAFAATLSLVPSSQVLAPGGLASVAVVADGLNDTSAPSLAGYDLHITFDPAVLALGQVIFGDPVLGPQLDLFGLGSLRGADPGAGGLRLYEISFDSAQDVNLLQAGRFTLATIEFSAIAAGASNLGLFIDAAGDADGAALPLTAHGSSVSVTSAVPEPGSMLTLLCGLAVLLGARYRLRRRG